MLTRRDLIATTAAGVAATSIAPRPGAATPANILVMARAIDNIVGAFDSRIQSRAIVRVEPAKDFERCVVDRSFFRVIASARPGGRRVSGWCRRRGLGVC